MKIYVLLFHDTWDIGSAEDISVEGLFRTEEAALAAQTEPADPDDYWSIEAHELAD